MPKPSYFNMPASEALANGYITEYPTGTDGDTVLTFERDVTWFDDGSVFASTQNLTGHENYVSIERNTDGLNPSSYLRVVNSNPFVEINKSDDTPLDYTDEIITDEDGVEYKRRLFTLPDSGSVSGLPIIIFPVSCCSPSQPIKIPVRYNPPASGGTPNVGSPNNPTRPIPPDPTDLTFPCEEIFSDSGVGVSVSGIPLIGTVGGKHYQNDYTSLAVALANKVASKVTPTLTACDTVNYFTMAVNAIFTETVGLMPVNVDNYMKRPAIMRVNNNAPSLWYEFQSTTHSIETALAQTEYNNTQQKVTVGRLGYTDFGYRDTHNELHLGTTFRNVTLSLCGINYQRKAYNDQIVASRLSDADLITSLPSNRYLSDNGEFSLLISSLSQLVTQTNYSDFTESNFTFLWECQSIPTSTSYSYIYINITIQVIETKCSNTWTIRTADASASGTGTGTFTAQLRITKAHYEAGSPAYFFGVQLGCIRVAKFISAEIWIA